MFPFRRGKSRATTGEADRPTQDADAPVVHPGVREQDEWSAGHRSRRAARLPTARRAEAVDAGRGRNAWAAAGRPIVDGHGNHGCTA
ncbi:hypothetical protein [Streptomyces sp. NPDC056160]|uniref:hypothetical protein n=1 Tax=Streptomyces sp. NPDC056160 TaxID=3345731 RepID=UPI0035D6E556